MVGLQMMSDVRVLCSIFCSSIYAQVEGETQDKTIGCYCYCGDQSAAERPGNGKFDGSLTPFAAEHIMHHNSSFSNDTIHFPNMLQVRDEVEDIAGKTEFLEQVHPCAP